MAWRTVFAILTPAGLLLIVAGVLVHTSGGFPDRFAVPPGADRPGTFKAFNMSVLARKRDRFASHGDRLLVLGNSTARDFVNMVNATKSFASYEIVYRDDLDVCEWDGLTIAKKELVSAATLIVRVFDHVPTPTCDARRLAALPMLRGKIVFVGPKDFGVNLNPSARLPLSARPTAMVAMSDEVLAASRYYRSISPPDLYVDMIGHLSRDGRHVPVFDATGASLVRTAFTSPRQVPSFSERGCSKTRYGVVSLRADADDADRAA